MAAAGESGREGREGRGGEGGSKRGRRKGAQRGERETHKRSLVPRSNLYDTSPAAKRIIFHPYSPIIIIIHACTPSFLPSFLSHHNSVIFLPGHVDGGLAAVLRAGLIEPSLRSLNEGFFCAQSRGRSSLLGDSARPNFRRRRRTRRAELTDRVAGRPTDRPTLFAEIAGSTPEFTICGGGVRPSVRLYIRIVGLAGWPAGGRAPRLVAVDNSVVV